MASPKAVFPDELCPTRTMFRMSFVSYLGIRSSGGTGAGDGPPYDGIPQPLEWLENILRSILTVPEGECQSNDWDSDEILK
jgi:hypothetical protein